MTDRDREDKAISAADACVFSKFGSYSIQDNPAAMTFWVEVFWKVYSNLGRI